MSGLGLFGIIVIASTFGIIIFCLVMYAVIQRKRHFLCPLCGARFKVPAMKSFFASRKTNGVDRLLACPRCGRISHMENIPDAQYAAMSDEEKAQEQEKYDRILKFDEEQAQKEREEQEQAQKDAASEEVQVDEPTKPKDK
ncbi:MAG: hypothetical protein RR777_00260 [Christensenellaceae bacterium]